MSTSRSLRIAAGHLDANQESTVYTVPADKVLLLKSVAAQNGTGSANVLYVIALQGTPSFTANVLQVDFTAFQVVHQQPWIVLEPLDELHVRAGPGEIAFWLSGALILA